jgi:hypothetical protein
MLITTLFKRTHETPMTTGFFNRVLLSTVPFFLRPATEYAITSTVSDSVCPDRLCWDQIAIRQPAAA